MTQGRTSSIYLGLLLHNHQPVGNFPWVFQQVYEEAYLPMINALERHPAVRLSLHYTGSLLDWFSEAQPEFLARIAALVKRNQVEMVGGGYYEPILPSIPDADKIVQIRRLTERIHRDFGVTPTGMWIAERVWEPNLPRFLREAGIEWTILDDVHFKNIGLEDHDLYGYYATEDQSSVLKVYATSKALRYTIPWRPVGETIETLRSLATLDGSRIIVMGDDGEKFGSWPETGPYCWGHDGQSGWVEEFFTALEQNKEWLHTIPLGEYARQYPALGRAYIPTSSYIEMTEWALPPQKSYIFGKLLHQLEHDKQDTILQFMRGGFWRNFLVRYPEINNQHKKMLRVHDNLYSNGLDSHGLMHLLKAQANDTYWHGLFGGIYMGHVRSAIYHHLIKAENIADRQQYGDAHWQRYEFTDFDRDTRNELIIESDQQNLYIDTLHGSSEPGSPHTTVRTKEPGLDRYLVLDRYRRNSLIDHFLPAGLTLENFAQVRFEEQGNFVEQPYECHVQQNTVGLTITLTRSGQVRRAGALSPLPVQLTKTLFLPRGEERLLVRYRIENQGQTRLQTTFASEWNMHLLGGGHNDQAYYKISGHTPEHSYFDTTGEVAEVRAFHIGNTWIRQDMGFTLSKPATLWRFSIETVTGSEAGFERNHQGSCFVMCWPLLIEAGQSWQVDIDCQGGDTENPIDPV